MSFHAKKGTFAASTGTGTQAVTGVGFQPSVVIFWSVALTAAGSGAGAYHSFGVGVSSSSQWAFSYNDDDAVTTTEANRISTDTKCIVFASSGAVLDCQGALSSLDADGFTIDWGASGAPATAVLIHYLALGGTDLTGVKTGIVTGPASTGSQAITGVGFQPDLVLMATSLNTSTGALAASANLAIGFATSSSARVSSAIRSRDAQTTSDVASLQVENKILSGLLSNSAGVSGTYDLTSMDADGFTLNNTTAASGAKYGYLALKGGHYKVGMESQKTSTGTKATTGAGFKPGAALFVSNGETHLTTVSSTRSRLTIGGTDFTTEGCTWVESVDALTTMDTNQRTNTTKSIVHATTAAGLLGEADATADADGFTLDWTTADANAREFHYLLFGGLAQDQALTMQAGAVSNAGANPTITREVYPVRMQAGAVSNAGGLHSIALSSSAQAVTLNAGAVANAGGLHTISGVPAAVALLAGSVANAGGLHTILRGPVSLTMLAGSVANGAGLLTISGVPAAVVLNAGAVSNAAGLLTIPSARTITMLAGAVGSAGGLLTLSGGILSNIPAIITYKIEVEWDNAKDGSSLIIGTGTIGTKTLWNPTGNPAGGLEFDGPYDDVTAYAKRFTIDRGRGSIADPTFAGRAEVVLHDPSGLFNPANSGSPLAGQVAPMRLLRITATYNGTSYVLFRGQLRRVAHRPSAGRTYSETVLTAEDYLMLLSRAERGIESTEDLAVDTMADHLLTSSPLSEGLWDVDTTTPSSSGSLYLSGRNGAVLPLLSELAAVEQGQVYASRGGTVWFRARGYRGGTVVSASPIGTISGAVAGLVPSVALDSITNRARVTSEWQGVEDVELGHTQQVAANDPSIQAYGPSEVSLSSSFIHDDAHAANVAAFIVARDADPANEIQAVTLRSSDTATIALMLRADVNDPVRVADASAGTATYWVEGVAHESSSKLGEHTTKLTLSKVKTGLPTYTG